MNDIEKRLWKVRKTNKLGNVHSGGGRSAKRKKVTGYKFESQPIDDEMPMRRSLKEKLPRAVRLAFVFVIFVSLITGSLMPSLAPSTEHGIDLAVHASVYAIVTVFTVLLFERPLMSAIVILALSGFIEVLQDFVPGRTGSLGDLAANGFGIAVALGVVWIMGAMGFRRVAVKAASEEVNARILE